MSNGVQLNNLTLGYWEQRWKDNKTGWHKSDVNPLLNTYHSQMLPSDGQQVRVFFPLCGKAIDMRFIAEMGHQVIGVEFTTQAVEEFFSEQKLTFTKSTSGEFGVYTSEKITIYQGDFFKVTTDLIGGSVEAIWDRGSLVAMNPSDRVKYAATISALTNENTKYLISALSYDQQQHGGPPFSTPKEVVDGLYCQKFNVEQIYEGDNQLSQDRFKTDWWKEALYLLTRKN